MHYIYFLLEVLGVRIKLISLLVVDFDMINVSFAQFQILIFQ